MNKRQAYVERMMEVCKLPSPRAAYIDRLRSYDPGQWCMFPYGYLLILRERDAIFLSHLVNQAYRRISKEQDDYHWFQAPTSSLKKDLPYTKGKIETCLRSLEKLNIIETKVVGIKRIRWIKIDIDLVTLSVALKSVGEALEVLSKARECGLWKARECGLWKARECGLPLKSNTKNIKDKEHCRNFVTTVKDRVWNKYGKRLHTSVSNVRKVNAKSKPRTWPQCFQLLHEKDHIEKERIRKVLQWYCNLLDKGGDLITNGNPQFAPIAYSGPKFREKFDNLEAAMHRDQYKKSSIPKQPTIKVRKILISKEEGDWIKENDPDCLTDPWLD